MVRFEWGGETLQLHAERAVLWERRATLIITDPHFGKAATLRHAGIPVPPGTTSTDLQRIDRLLARTGATRLLILGDFFHAPAGRADATMRAVGQWRDRRRGIDVVLVPGNHDRSAGPPPQEWGVRCVEGTLDEPPLRFCHHPCRADDAYVMSGHVHPAVLLEDNDGTSVRLPCFHFAERQALLPAFGRFTGAKRITPRQGDRVFVTTGDDVFEVRGR